jgi:hypothetical protein
MIDVLLCKSKVLMNEKCDQQKAKLGGAGFLSLRRLCPPHPPLLEILDTQPTRMYWTTNLLDTSLASRWLCRISFWNCYLLHLPSLVCALTCRYVRYLTNNLLSGSINLNRTPQQQHQQQQQQISSSLILWLETPFHFRSLSEISGPILEDTLTFRISVFVHVASAPKN